MTKRFSLHPTFIFFCVAAIVTGNVATYSAVLCSLFVHELGHIIVAKMYKVRITTCILYPFGGQLKLVDQQLTWRQLSVIASGGPLATLLFLVALQLGEGLFVQLLKQAQFALLCLNLLPIWPLDGGKIIGYQLLSVKNKTWVMKSAISFSFLFVTFICIVMMKYGIFTYTLFVFVTVWWQLLMELRALRYVLAYETFVTTRLSS